MPSSHFISQPGWQNGNWPNARTVRIVATAKSTSKSGKAAKKAEEKQRDNERVVAQNRRARFEFDIIETLECGIVLVGSEVKSLRQAHVTIEEAYARVKGNEVWLLGCDIPEYKWSNRLNHQPRRPRKLLMHRREVKRFAMRANEKGLTLVPLKLYFKEGRAKVLLGLGRGKQLHDKRETIKQRSVKRDIDRAMRRR